MIINLCSSSCKRT